MSIRSSLEQLLEFVEFIFSLFLLLVTGLFCAYIPSPEPILRSRELRKILRNMPYAEVAIHAKKGEPLLDLANTAGGIARDELLAYALVFNPEVRHGVRALLAVMTLVIAINIGADYFVLYAAIAVLALFALIKISRGCAEIL